jgi:hypothetical protein
LAIPWSYYDICHVSFNPALVEKIIWVF